MMRNVVLYMMTPPAFSDVAKKFCMFCTFLMLAFAAASLHGQGPEPCESNGAGWPYVSTNPNYVCEGVEAFTYINLAPGYASSTEYDAQAFNYSWYPAALFSGIDTQSFTYTFTADVTIWVAAYDPLNNCMWIDTLEVSVAPGLDIVAMEDTVVCDVSGLILSAEISPPTAGLNWSWEPAFFMFNPNTANPEVFAPVNSWYTATVATGPGCEFSDSVYVEVLEGQLYLGVDEDLCEGQSVTLDSGLDPADDVLWSTGENTVSITAADSGTYWVTAQTVMGCTLTDTLEVDVHPMPTVVVIPDGAACDGQSVILQAQVTGGTTPIVYAWSTGEVGPVITVNETGLYEVTAVDIYTCGDNADFSPTFLPAPQLNLPADTALCFEEEGPLWLSVQQAFCSYLWSDGSTLPSLVLTSPDTLGVVVTHLQSACTDSVTMVVVDFCPSDSVYFPTGFTPNDDSVNDAFGGYGEGIGTFRLLVFNRWGELMFEGDSLDAHWDGTVGGGGGKPASPGAYTFRATYRPIVNGAVEEGRWFEQLGTVILIR